MVSEGFRGSYNIPFIKKKTEANIAKYQDLIKLDIKNIKLVTIFSIIFSKFKIFYNKNQK